jgi:hypothetical protein
MGFSWDFWWDMMEYNNPPTRCRNMGDLGKRTWDLRKGGPTKHGDLNHNNFI